MHVDRGLHTCVEQRHWPPNVRIGRCGVLLFTYGKNTLPLKFSLMEDPLKKKTGTCVMDHIPLTLVMVPTHFLGHSSKTASLQGRPRGPMSKKVACGVNFKVTWHVISNFPRVATYTVR